MITDYFYSIIKKEWIYINKISQMLVTYLQDFCFE